MPRSNRKRRGGRRAPPRSRAGTGGPGPRPAPTEQVSFRGQWWTVRSVRGTSGSERHYRCPGCQQEVSAAVAHVVVWPTEAMAGLDNRRHWHAPCWGARERRGSAGSWA